MAACYRSAKKHRHDNTALLGVLAVVVVVMVVAVVVAAAAVGICSKEDEGRDDVEITAKTNQDGRC